MLYFLDCEVFKYDWLFVIIDPVKQQETIIVNDPMKLKHFYDEHRGDICITFNGRNYDNYIFKSILLGFDPYEVSDFIINQHHKGWEYSNLFNKIPLISFDVFTGYNGLKTLEAFMGNDIRETTVPFDIDRKLTKEEIDETIYYCRHDVEQTIEVFLRRKNEFDSHMDLIKEFNLPLIDLGKTQAQLAAKILGARRINLNDEFDLRLPPTLKLDKYKFIADWFLSIKDKVTNELGHLNMGNYNEFAKLFYAQKLEVEIGGIPHVVAWGGLHGSADNFIYECKEDEMIIQCDAASLYPSIMIQYDLLSRAVTNKNRFINVYNTNLKYKYEHNKKRREPFKRICNIVYGATGDRYNAMYDPLHRNLVCVYGQLLIIDLIEKLEPYGKFLDNNTDGIVMLIKKKDLETIRTIYHEWEERVHLTLEEDDYVSIIHKDVANYILIDKDGNYKCKGAYVKELNDLDYDLPIINKALTDYFVKGTPIEETINSCDRLIEFQKVVKLSSNYNCGGIAEKFGPMQTRWINVSTDKTYRVFASKDSKDGYIGKQKEAGGTIEKFANTPEHCFIDNSDVKNKRIPRKLDVNWYIDLANERLKQFLGKE